MEINHANFGLGKSKKDKRKKVTSPTAQRIARSWAPDDLHRSALKRTQ